MKGKLFIGLAFAALATGGCFLAGNSTPRHQFTPEEIANIEALTENESNEDKKTCYSSITSQDGCQVRYCPTCEYLDNSTKTWYAPSHKCPE